MGEIRRVRVSDSGEVAVGQETAGFILLYDVHGDPIASLGRRGEGPGEFRGIPVFNWIGDSLFAGDARLSIFSRTGNLVRSSSWAQPMVLHRSDTIYHPFFGGGVLLGIRADEQRLLIASVNTSSGAAPADWAEGERSPQQAVIRVGSDGLVRSIYARGPIFEPEGCRGEFCRRTLAATSPNAGRVAIAKLLSEDKDSIVYLITSFEDDGTRIWERRLSEPQSSIPEAVWDSIDQARAAERQQVDATSLSGRSGSGGSANRSPVAPRLTTYPAFRELLVSREGRVWLQRFHDRVWLVIAADGTTEREVVLDRGVRLQAVAGDTLWAVTRDSNDVPSVLRLKLKAVHE